MRDLDERRALVSKLSTLIVFVQDETGSMKEIEDTTISAFNEYFGTLQSNASEFGDVNVNVWQFSSAHGEERVRPLYRGALQQVPQLNPKNYRPRGNTPLLDAIGTAIAQAEGMTADRVLFIIQTDGLENDSKEFTRAEVEKMVQQKEKDKNWTVVFLGAGIAEWVGNAQQMGAQKSSAVSYAPAQTRAAYASVSHNSTELLSSDNTSDKKLGEKIQRDVSKS